TKGVQWLANKWKNRNQGAGERIENDLRHDEVRVKEQIARQTKEIGRKVDGYKGAIVRGGMKDPQRLLKDGKSIEIGVRDNTINITEYTEDHVKLRVAMLVKDHLDTYGEKQFEKTIQDMIRSSPDYKKKVREIAIRDPYLTRADSNISTDSREAITRAMTVVETGEYDTYFFEARQDILNNKAAEITSKYKNELTNAYTKFLEREINVAKEDARKDLDMTFSNAADAKIKKSELTIQEDVITRVKEAEKIAVGDAEETDKLFKDGEKI
ncbi:MAG: hypothetical protein ACOYK4_07480, partial [Candidatus Planktophila sp.]